MAEIPLRARDGSVRAYAIVDDEDFDWLSQWRWHLSAYGYAQRRSGGKLLWMHVQIMQPSPSFEVDHRNGDGLDNRRVNLRVVTHQQNAENMRSHRDARSGYRGVSWHTGNQCWRARVTVRGRTYQRYAATEAEAARLAVELRARHMTHANEERH